MSDFETGSHPALQPNEPVDYSSMLAAALEPPRDYNLADYTYEVIVDRIKEFEDELDQNHEVGVMLASFGKSITMAVTAIGYSNPSTLVFYGTVNGQAATLIQHVTQLNFLLLALEKADPEKPPRRIGFALPTED